MSACSEATDHLAAVGSRAYSSHMSEEGWARFVAEPDRAGWVVLHGGPTAVYRVDSLAAATRLASAIAEVEGLGPRIVLTAAADRLTVKLTREMWATEHEDLRLTAQISAIAHDHGAVADPGAVQEVQVAVSAQPEAIDLGFWRAALGYDPLHEDNCLDPTGQSSTVWMQELDPAKPLRHAMHLDVSLAREHVAARVDAAVAAGGTVVQHTHPTTWILADRSGNKVCLTCWPDGGAPD